MTQSEFLNSASELLQGTKPKCYVAFTRIPKDAFKGHILWIDVEDINNFSFAHWIGVRSELPAELVPCTATEFKHHGLLQIRQLHSAWLWRLYREV